jgi:hypothetical protein
MKKRNKTLLLPLNIVRAPNTNLVMLRAVLDKEFTRLDFGYIAINYFIRGGWIRISSETYINVKGHQHKYVLTHAKNIPIAPEQHHFESSKDWQYFSLYFPPIPQQDCLIDLIEEENPDDNDFNYYGIHLDMSTAEEVLQH